MIDLDMVHNVFLEKYDLVNNRQCGKTFSSCFKILGAVELGDKNIYYITKYYGSIDLIISMFIEIIEEIRDYDVIRTNKNSLNILNSHIKFISEYEADQKLKGIDNFTIVEMEL